MGDSKKVEIKKLWILSISAFLCFLLELISILAIEQFIFGTLSFNSWHKTIHSLWISILWSICIIFMVRFSKKNYSIQNFSNIQRIKSKDWIIVMACLLVCKCFTFMDWHTLKIIGEFNCKPPLQFITQYLYYFAEVFLVMLIILFAQEAWDRAKPKLSYIPIGGIVLSLTWGAFHFFSHFNGLEIWNGISCMIFSILSGIIYTHAKNNIWIVYLLLCLGYLL